jgi:TPR repeat protein
MQSGGYGQSAGYPAPQRTYTDRTAPPPIKVLQRSATAPISQAFAPSVQSPKYPGQTTYEDPAEYVETTPASSSLAPYRPENQRSESDQSLKYKTFSTYVHHDVFSDYFKSQDEGEEDEEEMPNFAAAPSNGSNHHRGNSIDDHLRSPGNGSYAAYNPSTQEPVANQFQNAGFQFDLPGDGRSNGPGRAGSMGSYGSNSHHDNVGNPPRPYRTNSSGMYDDAEQNPDSLPAHPTPFRAGLDSAAPGPKPTPVRQYSIGQQSAPQSTPQAAQAPHPKEPSRPQSPPVTQVELERLQLFVRRNPDDGKAALNYAKKLVEASRVLIGEEGRVDPKTRARNREKFVVDAYKIVKKLVSNGFPEAMFYMADCYGQGALGLPVDTKEAFLLYQSAAKAGHAEAAYRTAVCCELGNEDGGGTKRDALKAVQWYRRAAALGNTPAMYKMGIILLKGLLGQQKNPREAVPWLKRAAERADEENPHALHELGLMYSSTNNNDFIVRDEEYSMQLFTQAAELGYKFSQYRLGAAYEFGYMGCVVDTRQSIIWYTRAAAQGEHQSELALSGWYLTGAEGILQQSDTEAYLWARKAASAGLAKAEYAMGYFTEVGIGVPSNMEDAKRWYWRASGKSLDLFDLFEWTLTIYV